MTSLVPSVLHRSGASVSLRQRFAQAKSDYKPTSVTDAKDYLCFVAQEVDGRLGLRLAKIVGCGGGSSHPALRDPHVSANSVARNNHRGPSGAVAYWRAPQSSVVVVPSLNYDPEILKKVTGASNYEERQLCNLFLLRQHDKRVVMVTSQKIPDHVVAYYLSLDGCTAEEAA